MIQEIDIEKLPIPEKSNIAITVLSIPLLCGLLWVASHAEWYWMLLAAWLFSLLNNTPFALMHEAVHGVFSANRSRNDFFGILCGLPFPTSFTLQRIAHLGHHRRNRTDRELYDYYLPDQSKALRNFQLYSGNLMGLYWFCIPISNLILLIAPWLYRSQWFIQGPARTLGFEPYIEEIAQGPVFRIWMECFAALIYQITLFWLLDLNWQGWLLCYWAFALHWSALQYVDHAWSPRDVLNGAWNLKVTSISRAIGLNFYYHLVHHRFPTVPWIHLPKLVNPDEKQPTFWEIYFSLWRGVKPAPPMVTD